MWWLLLHTGAPVPQKGHVSGRRGHSVFTSAVQYTQSPTAIYAHFDTWPADGTLTLSKGPWPAEGSIKATLLGLGKVELLEVTVSASKQDLTIQVRLLVCALVWCSRLASKASSDHSLESLCA
jgi:hypothetical protein